VVYCLWSVLSPQPSSLSPLLAASYQLPVVQCQSYNPKTRSEGLIRFFPEGDFYVALYFARVYKTTTLLLCRNNQCAISVPRQFQTASPSLAEKAAAYNIEGVEVDGNDILAVYAVTREVTDRPRRGEGATLVEAVTCRQGGHSTSDDPRHLEEQPEELRAVREYGSVQQELCRQ